MGWMTLENWVNYSTVDQHHKSTITRTSMNQFDLRYATQPRSLLEFGISLNALVVRGGDCLGHEFRMVTSRVYKSSYFRYCIATCLLVSPNQYDCFHHLMEILRPTEILTVLTLHFILSCLYALSFSLQKHSFVLCWVQRRYRRWRL